MGKIKLSDQNFDSVITTTSPILIVNSKDEQGYKTQHGFVRYGEYVVSAINYDFEMQSDIEQAYNYDGEHGCFLDEEGVPVSIGFSSQIFVPSAGIKMKDVVHTINSGRLSEDMRSKIRSNALTLPFGVGIYKNAPVLYYKGEENNLFLYDLLMVIQNSVTIRLCKNCGHAFISSNNKQYCSRAECQQAIIQNKWKSAKHAPTGDYKRIRQRIEQKIKGKSENSHSKTPKWYNDLYYNLSTRLIEQRNNFPPKPNGNIKFGLWIKDWQGLLAQINQVSKYFQKHSDSQLLSKWSNECKNLPVEIKQLKKWANSWAEKIQSQKETGTT